MESDYRIALVGLLGVLAGALVTTIGGLVRAWIDGQRAYRKEVRETFAALSRRNTELAIALREVKRADETYQNLRTRVEKFESKTSDLQSGDDRKHKKRKKALSEMKSQTEIYRREHYEADLRLERAEYEYSHALEQFSTLVGMRTFDSVARGLERHALGAERTSESDADQAAGMHALKKIAAVRWRERMTSRFMFAFFHPRRVRLREFVMEAGRERLDMLEEKKRVQRAKSAEVVADSVDESASSERDSKSDSPKQ